MNILRSTRQFQHLRLFPTNLSKRSLSNPTHASISPPPSLFQNNSTKPLKYHELIENKSPIINSPIVQSDTKIRNNSSSINTNIPLSESNKLTISQLFINKSTRGSVIKIVLSLGLLQAIIFFISSNAIMDELSESESKLLELWGFYERKDISQTVMAVHIGQLRQQLIKLGVNPVTTTQSLMVAQHLLSFDRDNTGNLLIYVDPNCQIYNLVPFSYEYDIQKIPKLNNVVDTTWEDFNSHKNIDIEIENDIENEKSLSSTVAKKVVVSDKEGKEKK